MIRARSIAALFLIAIAPAFSQSSQTRSNVQQSLGFENQTGSTLTGWHSYPAGSITADNAIAHRGRWSVRLERDAGTTGTFSVMSDSLPVDFAGATVELRAYLRLQDVSNFAGLWLREDADGEALALENMQTQEVKGTRGWAQYHVTLPIRPKAQQLFFGALVSGTGTLWADDMELLVDGKPIAEAASALPHPGLPPDHVFDSASEIALSQVPPTQVANLVTLARVWGFLKYHHPAVTAGQRQWDYELFRILPAVLAAPDRANADAQILAWINRLGPFPVCNPCVGAPGGDLEEKPAVGWIHDRAELGAALSQRLESIYTGRTGEQFYVSLAPGSGNPSFDHELTYPRMKFPDPGFQLLALFRWWNIMQYWAPNRDRAGQDWTAVLADFIPRIALAKDKDAYQLTMLELIAKANDTHATLSSSFAVRPPVGFCAIPATFRFIDDKLVLYRADSLVADVKPGDVIDTLDAASVSSLVEEWTPYYADSNEAARQRDLAGSITRGSCVPVFLGITRNEHTQRVVVARTKDNYGFVTHDQRGDTFRMLSTDVAYVKLSSVKTEEVPGYFEKAKGTKGLIIDIRNYPSAFMPFVMGAYLATKPTSFVSFTLPELANPGAFHFADGPLIRPGPVHYSGKVVILVDETTQSQAEYTAMALRAMPNSLVVGSTTAGADGNVSRIPLPGGLSTMISGIGVFYPDRRPTQRVGIVPDVVVRPTIEGIAAGRDEVLETAIRIVEEKE